MGTENTTVGERLTAKNLLSLIVFIGLLVIMLVHAFRDEYQAATFYLLLLWCAEWLQRTTRKV
jgi:hypothetical protein